MSLPNWIYALSCRQKVDRVLTRQDPNKYQSCESCGMHRWQEHKPECELFTPEQAKAIKQAHQQEEHARKQAANYLEQLQAMHGKIALLKRENNKLRKANERLKAKGKP